eukprot:SM000241S08516  [mRNA]  locus=s241:141194:143826:+ [translate_table: standard]
MVLWIFGYGSLVWRAGFEYDRRVVGYIRGYRRVFYQGSTDHRGTPELPGRTVTLEPQPGAVTLALELLSITGVASWATGDLDSWFAKSELQGGLLRLHIVGCSSSCKFSASFALMLFKWGAAYCIEGGPEAEEATRAYLEIREKQYDVRATVDFFTRDCGSEPAVSNVLTYIATTNKQQNPNYLGEASVDDIARQIASAVGPSGPNYEYLFQLREALVQQGAEVEEETESLCTKVRLLLGTTTAELPGEIL